MAQDPCIREYREADENQVIGLWEAVFPDSPSWNIPADDIQRKLAVQRNLFLVAEIDGTVVGTVLAGFDGHRGWLHRMAVASGVRRQGIGRALVVQAERLLQRLGCTKVNLQVRGTNREAAEFYRKLGYALEDRVSLGKRLPAAENPPKQAPSRNLATIEYRDTRKVPRHAVLDLYRANNWSSADKPEELHQALLHSHSLVTAWDGTRLVGLGNAISDGFLVVYYPHFVVHPDYHRQGIGAEMMARLMKRYKGFHQHSLIADKNAVAFYESCGFEQSDCAAMWIYQGNDH